MCSTWNVCEIDEVFHAEHFVRYKLYVHKCMMSFKTRGLREKEEFEEAATRPSGAWTGHPRE